MSNDIIKYEHTCSTRYKINDIMIRRLLEVNYIIDHKINLHLYKSNKIFYLSKNKIVVDYEINTFNSKVIIPIIGMDNIRSKILFHRHYMIYLKYKKRLWRKIRRHFITKYFSNVLPIELSRYIASIDMYI